MVLYDCNDGWYALRLTRTHDITYADDMVTRFKLEGLGLSVTVDSEVMQKTYNNSGDMVLVFAREHEFDVVADNGSGALRVNGSDLLTLVSRVTQMQKLNIPSNSKRASAETNREPSELTRFRQMMSDVRIEGRYAPMDHQFKSAYFKVQNKRAFDLSTMRTGKTGSTMLALEYLFRQGLVKRVMVIAPLSCVRPVWVDAIKQTMPRHIAVAVTGTKPQRLKAFKAMADIFVTNYESLKLHPKEWRKIKPDAIVIDECTHYANLTSDRTRAIRTFITDVQPSYVWGLTGTPGYDPLKAFAMSKVINPGAVQCRTVTAWRDLTQYRWGPQAWQWKNKDCAPQMIRQALSPAVLFKKDDLFDLPPVVYTAREVEQSSQQAQLMNRLRDDMVAFAESGEQITAQQKSVLVSKLLQCACGAVYTDDNKVLELDITKRVDMMQELIEEATGKTVIFSAFTGAINRLHDKLKERGIKCAVVNGATSERARADIFRKFQNVEKGKGEVDVLIAHPRTTAFGVELAAADMMIFDGAPLSGDFVFGQAVERLSSLKQKAKQITIAQVYSCREERKVFNALTDGQSQSQVVSDLFDSIIK